MRHTVSYQPIEGGKEVRDYQDMTRAEIETRIDELRAQNREYGQCVERVEREVKEQLARGGLTFMDTCAIEWPALRIQSELTQRQITNAKEVQGLQVELHIRETPELVKEFGPGRD